MSQKLSYEDFLKSFEFAPRLAVELLVENASGKLLLLQRDREPFKGYWHLPGGFLLKDETIAECVSRLAHEELATQLDYEKAEFLGIFENINGDPRGHILHYVVRFKRKDVADKHYFDHLPQQTITYQKGFLKKLFYTD